MLNRQEIQFPQKKEEWKYQQCHLVEAFLNLRTILISYYSTQPTLSSDSTTQKYTLFEFQVRASINQLLSTHHGIKLTNEGKHTVPVALTTGTQLPEEGRQKNL